MSHFGTHKLSVASQKRIEMRYLNLILSIIFYTSFYKQLEAQLYYKSNTRSPLDMKMCDTYTIVTV